MPVQKHNLSITLLLASKAENMSAKHLCCIQTKMYRLYKINGHFSIQSIHFCLDTMHLGSTIRYNLKPSYNELSYKDFPVYLG